MELPTMVPLIKEGEAEPSPERVRVDTRPERKGDDTSPIVELLSCVVARNGDGRMILLVIERRKSSVVLSSGTATERIKAFV